MIYRGKEISSSGMQKICPGNFEDGLNISFNIVKTANWYEADTAGTAADYLFDWQKNGS